MALGEIRIRDLLIAASAAACLSACMGGVPPRKPPNAMFPQAQAALAERANLKAFDADANGDITKAELEAGLERLYAEFDVNRDGVLRAAEIAAAAARLQAGDASMPPLRDWNQSGAVEFEEYAAWNRGKFRRADANQDEIVTAAELAAPPSMPARAPRGGPPGGGMPDGRLSQPVATADARAL